MAKSWARSASAADRESRTTPWLQRAPQRFSLTSIVRQKVMSRRDDDSIPGGTVALYYLDGLRNERHPKPHFRAVRHARRPENTASLGESPNPFRWHGAPSAFCNQLRLRRLLQHYVKGPPQRRLCRERYDSGRLVCRHAPPTAYPCICKYPPIFEAFAGFREKEERFSRIFEV